MDISIKSPPTTVWGPYFWYVIHTVAFNYPENPTDYNKMSYKNFFESFSNVLPCKKCREHYQTHLSRHPISPFLDNNKLLNKWVIDLHNLVNKSLNKPQLTYNQVYQIYQTLEPLNPFYKTKVADSVITKQKYNDTKKYKLYGLIFMTLIAIFFLIKAKKDYCYIY